MRHVILTSRRADISQAILADVTNVAKSGPDPNLPATESAVISALRKGIDKRVSEDKSEKQRQ